MAYFQNGVWKDAGAPRWLADYSSRDHLVPGGVKLNAAEFPLEGTVVVTAPTGALAAAVSISVSPLSGALPSGAVLDFTGAGEFAKLTAPAAVGAVTLSVEALDAAIEAGDTATYVGMGKRFIAAGTVVGRTQAEEDASTGFGPAVSSDNHIYILRFAIEDASDNADGVLVRPGAVIKYNLLPEVIAGTLASAVLTSVRGKYTTVRGVS